MVKGAGRRRGGTPATPTRLHAVAGRHGSRRRPTRPRVAWRSPATARAAGQRPDDQACSWRTRSLSIANVQTALVEVEQVEQVGIDVELDAVLAEAARDAEAQPLGARRRRRNAVSKRLTTSLPVQRGQRSRVRAIRSSTSQRDALWRPGPDSTPGRTTSRHDPTVPYAHGAGTAGPPPLLHPKDRLRLRPVLLELVEVALGRREDVDDHAAEVEQDPVRGGDALAPDRPDPLGPQPATMPSAIASSWRSEPPEQMTKVVGQGRQPRRSSRTMSAAFLSSASSTIRRASSSGSRPSGLGRRVARGQAAGRRWRAPGAAVGRRRARRGRSRFGGSSSTVGGRRRGHGRRCRPTTASGHEVADRATGGDPGPDRRGGDGRAAARRGTTVRSAGAGNAPRPSRRVGVRRAVAGHDREPGELEDPLGRARSAGRRAPRPTG